MPERKSPSWESKFEKKIKQMETRIDELAKKVEERGEVMAEKAEEKSKTLKENVKQKGGHGLFWGLVLIVIGILWLGNNLNWFLYDVPWFPVVMIAGGIYLIFRYWESEKSSRMKDKTDENTE